jgi:hypothetical protein
MSKKDEQTAQYARPAAGGERNVTNPTVNERRGRKQVDGGIGVQ